MCRFVKRESKRIPRKIKKRIPKGHYCYTPISIDPETFNMSIRSCVFFKYIKCKDKPEECQDEIDKEYPEERVGWCKHIRYEIDDQCKMCSINM